MPRLFIALALIALSTVPAAAQLTADRAVAVPGSTGNAVPAPTFRAPSPYPYPVPQQPQPVACTMEAKLCPDGSYVSRTGTNCAFAPCPGGGNGAAPVPQPVEEEPAGLRDLPLVGIPANAVSIEFLTEHRSALSGKTLTVKGYVTDFCAPGGDCGDPHVSLADEADGSGYSMTVQMSSSDLTTYTVGQAVEIYGEASAEGEMVSLRKE